MSRDKESTYDFTRRKTRSPPSRSIRSPAVVALATNAVAELGSSVIGVDDIVSLAYKCNQRSRLAFSIMGVEGGG